MLRGKVTEGLTEAKAAHLAALDKPEPIVPRPLIQEVTERVDYKGATLIELDEKEANQILETLIANGVESITICLLWSVTNGSHEKTIADMCRKKYLQVR